MLHENLFGQQFSKNLRGKDKEIAQPGEMVELEVNHTDVDDFIRSHNWGLTTEDLQELNNFIEHDGEKEE